MYLYNYNCEKANEILTKNSKIFTWKQYANDKRNAKAIKNDKTIKDI